MTSYYCIDCGSYIGEDIFSSFGDDPKDHDCPFKWGRCGYCGGPLNSRGGGCGCNGFGRKARPIEYRGRNGDRLLPVYP
jgi:hypothetical protein